MKSIIFKVLGAILLLSAAVFSGVFYEDFGAIRGLRAKHLLVTTPKMLEGFKAVGGPINAQVTTIEAKYITDLAELESKRDNARNTFFKLPKDTRDTSEEGKTQKTRYLDAAYEMVIIENQKNLEVATLKVDQYTKGKVIRLENI
jgi:hypothetical protein